MNLLFLKKYLEIKCIRNVYCETNSRILIVIMNLEMNYNGYYISMINTSYCIYLFSSLQIVIQLKEQFDSL